MEGRTVTLSDAISFVLGNIQIPLFVIAVIVTIVKLRRASARHEVMTASYTLWGEVLFYCFGLGFVYVWYMHAFMSAMVAPMIGWKPSPFEWELAWSELGMGVIAIISLWRGYDMRLAATLVPSVFLFGAAAQHIHLMMTAHNYAPGNSGAVLWFGDIALPLFTLFLALASRDAYERRRL
ncbi:MAG TPA: DUF6790 family protein [Candidatus Baltobacteraceae bacterium]